MFLQFFGGEGEERLLLREKCRMTGWENEIQPPVTKTLMDILDKYFVYKHFVYMKQKNNLSLCKRPFKMTNESVFFFAISPFVPKIFTILYYAN